MRVPVFLLAATLAAAAVPAAAQVSVNIQLPGLVEVAPPAPRYERVPMAQPGQVWVPGHWRWNDRGYAWSPGYRETARPDREYAPGRWVRAEGGWRWLEGDWRRARKAKHREPERYDNDPERDEDHDRGHGGHCPPGQAKKGRC
ncbi:MAG: hypothetical protein JWQ03_2257 [Variovorax sp.]|nr:hypothetical protein [Variovorax sp.]